jgi:hypothetical protein
MRDMETVIDGPQMFDEEINSRDYYGKGVPLVRVYSGHDSTLLPLLAAFEAHDGK